MTRFMGLSKGLMTEKWKLMNWIVGIDLIALLGIYILRIITGGFDGTIMPGYFFGLFMFSLSMVNIISFILLSRNNEHVFTSNNYRMIPTSDTKLYFSNILTTFLAYVYLQILEGILGAVIYFSSGQSGLDITTNSSYDVIFALQILILAILGPILLWSAITLIHFLINWIGNFLPFGRQKFVTFILYLVVTWIGASVFNFITGYFFKMLYNSGFFGGIDGRLVINNLSQFNSAIWTVIGVAFVWVALFSAINIYLLKRWTETIR